MSDAEYNRNFYVGLGDIGQEILGFLSLSERLMAYEDVVDLKTPPSQFRRETDAYLRTMGRAVDKLAGMRVGGQLAPLKDEAAAFVRESVRLAELQRDSRIRQESSYEKQIKQQYGRAVARRERLDKLIEAYCESRRQSICLNCRTWVDVGSRTCPFCGRDFDTAARLNVDYMYTISIKSARTPNRAMCLQVSLSDDAARFREKFTIPILLFIDQMITRMAPAQREALFSELGRVRTEVMRQWTAKSFDGPSVQCRPSEDSLSLASFDVHFVTHSSDQQYDVLYDVRPVGFDVGPESAEFLLTLTKWILSPQNPEDKVFFVAIFAFACTDRWLNGEYLTEPGTAWLNKIMAGALRQARS